MTNPSKRKQSKPWRIHFFQRDQADDAQKAVPATEFLDSIPAKVAAEIHAVLEAVAAAPPPSFSGGGKWEAMHDDMAGYFEVRVQGGGMNHRLFCVLERDAEDLGGSSIVCIDGLSKPPRTAAHPRDYRRVKRYGAEFQKRRTVLE
jgi:Txe/YoeB family toxin of Txe-Axe toxin-antitoxin module